MRIIPYHHDSFIFFSHLRASYIHIKHLQKMQSTSDDRDARNMRQFVTRANGLRSWAPAPPVSQSGAICDCAIDPRTGRSYCICAPIMTTDMAFAQEDTRIRLRPATRMATPCERAALKRRQMVIAKSMA